MRGPIPRPPTCHSERSAAESKNLVAIAPYPLNPFLLLWGKVGACPELVEGMRVPLRVLAKAGTHPPLNPFPL